LAVAEALADNGRVTGNSGGLIGENNILPLSHLNNWQNAYFAINECNLILDGINNVSPAPTQATRDRWIGQIKFLRALYYFDLVRVWAYDPGVAVAAQDRGGVPISTTGIKTATEALTFLPARAPVSEVYALIYADLQDAATLLPNTGAPQYATSGAATALLSRVALYNKDYATAVSAATTALGSSVGAVLSGAAYQAGWRAAIHPESMFEVRFQVAAENIGVNESLQTSYTTIQQFSTIGNFAVVGGWGDLAPRLDFLPLLGITVTGDGTNAINVTKGDDARVSLYEVGPGRGSGRKVECIKFLGKTGTLNMDNVPVIRKSEMLLNRAEARATPGSAVLDEVAALADLNTFRAARNLPPVALTGTDLYEEILLQRRLEFAFEGHRWFDLKRLGRNVVKGATVLEYTDFKILPRIPLSQVDGNPNMVQNFGY
ncbi:MAG TPA: RagB/SusD family nutrient uptake outer membrane protein, partial [Cyclobacteriaceae bacterium]|nr:RagB/SusD family nutrient uptake outer membrane protein [Cyclobacteriaceae bacterium]